MTAVQSAVPSAVQPAVTPTSVAVDSKAQYGPYKPMSGSSIVPEVGRTEVPGDDDLKWQPGYAGQGSTGSEKSSGSKGAPSVPDEMVAGMFYKPGPIDRHYTDADESYNPYALVGDPKTRGRKSWIKSFANHVFNGTQNVNEAGWQQNSAQQRTSYMRMTMPPQGMGYDPETSSPKQLPQVANTQKFLPTTGTDAPGVGVLNSSVYGAGQVAAGEGGQLYSPEPGPPGTTSTAGQSAADGGMPVWG